MTFGCGFAVAMELGRPGCCGNVCAAGRGGGRVVGGATAGVEAAEITNPT